MTAAYLADVAALAAARAPLPPHEPLLAQEARGAAALVLRVAQFNLNVLHGPDFRTPVSGAAAAALLVALGADVLFLQEAGEQSFAAFAAARAPGAPPAPPSAWDGLPDPAPRLAELHAALRAAGYALLFADGVPNPALLATRLPVVAAGAAFPLDAGAFAARMLAARPPELRAARVVELALGARAGAPALAAAATHLHHTELGAPGLRAAEARALAAALAAAARARGGAALVATDANSVRARDYSPREWAAVAAGKGKIGEPAEDGVEAAFAEAGFSAAYDAAGGAPAFTHWTSTTVDFTYWAPPAAGAWRWAVRGVYVVPTGMSDHLPVVTDFDVVPVE